MIQSIANMNLAYRVKITPGVNGLGFNAEVLKLKGCVAFGETIEDALQTLTEVTRAWIEIAHERGWKVPLPEDGVQE